MTFPLQRTIFVFLVLVYDRVGDRDKFLCENFSLGRPRFHATCHLKIEANKLKLIHEYQRIATTAFLKSRIVNTIFFSVSNNVSYLVR